jgi:phosphoribosylanthranilate isomerase
MACSAGADAIGLVFYARSPRHVDRTVAQTILDTLPPFVTTTGLFVDASNDEVEQVLDVVPLDLLQFHGSETESYCRSFGRPYIKAIRMRADTDLRAACDSYPTAAGLLLDSYRQGVPGGTGSTFDWRAVPADLGLPLVVAGGLDAGNVGVAIATLKPWAVDVSSGVESAPGIKDAARIRAFMRAVGN